MILKQLLFLEVRSAIRAALAACKLKTVTAVRLFRVCNLGAVVEQALCVSR